MQDEKTRTKPFKTVVMTAGMLLAIATAALAYGPAGGGCTGGPGGDRLAGLEQRVQGLELDASTKTAVFAILDGARDSTRELQTQLRTEFRQMHELLSQATPDESAVLAQVDRISVTSTALRKHELRTMLAVFAQLTPDQRKALRPEHGPGPRHGRPGSEG